MAFSDEKDAIIAVVKARECTAASYISINASDYADLLDCLFEFSKTFDCDPAYLDSLLSLITPSELLANGVYYNQTLSSVTNPRYIAKSTITTVTLNSSFFGSLEITYNSVINTVVLVGASAENIVIAGGATVQSLEVQSGSSVIAVILKACGNHRGKLVLLKGPENVEDLSVDKDAVYGGSQCVPIAL